MKVHSTNLAFHMWDELTVLWNDLTNDWNDLTWNDLTMERNDRIPFWKYLARSHLDPDSHSYEAQASNY